MPAESFSSGNTVSKSSARLSDAGPLLWPAKLLISCIYILQPATLKTDDAANARQRRLETCGGNIGVGDAFVLCIIDCNVLVKEVWSSWDIEVHSRFTYTPV